MSGACRDLDDVIDQSGVRLIGIVPEDRKLAAAFARGRLPAADTPGLWRCRALRRASMAFPYRSPCKRGGLNHREIKRKPSAWKFEKSKGGKIL